MNLHALRGGLVTAFRSPRDQWLNLWHSGYGHYRIGLRRALLDVQLVLHLAALASELEYRPSQWRLEARELKEYVFRIVVHAQAVAEEVRRQVGLLGSRDL